MTNTEFSNEFDTILSSYPVVGASPIILDEYEKSVFLTKAEEEVVVDLYKGNGMLSDYFEKTEEIRRYLSTLVNTTILKKVAGITGLSKASLFFELPQDLLFITYESITLDDVSLGCKNGKEIQIVPITQDTYYKINKNPFRKAGTSRALRLDISNNIVELVSEYKVKDYLLRYIAKPEPIILVDLTDGLSINEISIETPCKLAPIVHRLILNRAVQLALLSKSVDKK